SYRSRRPSTQSRVLSESGGWYNPAWITPLLCVLVSRPARGCRSSTHTDRPVRAIASADAAPVTPAPTTATSIRSMNGILAEETERRSRPNSATIFTVCMAKRALITGITGQDGSYLAELLLEKGYEVFGMVRRSSAPNLWRIEHVLDRLTLRPADLLDQLSLLRLVDDVRPHEFYNLAAMSFVPASWDQPMLTGEFNSQGVTRILDVIRRVDTGIRFYQASSSEMFGKVRQVPQNELTPFHPRSPYGVSKVFAHYITVNYRES